jgi:hypothetical protein
VNDVATDQSHHYRAIIEMLKTEKENENDSEENLLESLLNPVLRVETADGEVGCVLNQCEKHVFFFCLFFLKSKF